MKTFTFRVDNQLCLWLAQEAKRPGRSKSEVVREALVEQRTGRKSLSVHDRMKDVCGSIKGAPRDLSANTRKYLKGFGT
jgi:hypothetical protein